MLTSAGKKSLPGLLLYFVLTTAVFYGAHLYLANSMIYRVRAEPIDNHYARLQAKLDAATRPLVLAIGNSYVRRSFVPGETHHNFHRFAVNGMNLKDAIGIVEGLPDDGSVGTVIVGLGYPYAMPVDSDSSMYRPHWADNALTRWWWSLPLVRGRTLAATLVKLDVGCLIGANNCNHRKPEDPGPADDLVLEDAAAEERTIRDRLVEYQPFTIRVNEGFSERLVELRDAASRRGLRLLTYTAPVHPRLLKQLHPRFLADFRETVRSHGIEYLDLNEVFPNWGRRYFRDATHLSLEGAAEVTSLLARAAGEHPGG